MSRSVLGELARMVVPAAKAPVPVAGRYSGAGLFGPTVMDAEAQLSAVGTNGTLYAIVNGLAEATAGATWNLYRPSPSGKVEDRTQVLKHAALSLWREPNKAMDPMTFVHTFQQHLEVVGEADWLVGRFGSIPTELWPVRPDRLTPQPDEYEMLAGWDYRSPTGQMFDLGVQDIVQLKLPNPVDPMRGMGPVQSVLYDIDSARYSAQWNRNFFKNSAMPGGVIEVPERLTDGEWTEMSDRWAQSHKGVGNAHRVGIIERGKWVPRTFSMRDMQFMELRGVQQEIIREAWRYPKPLLGTVDDVNRANAEAAEVMLARWLVVPRLQRIRSALNTRLLPMFGVVPGSLEFDFDNPVPDDRTAADAERDSKTTAYATLVAAGVDPVDAAKVVGLPPMRMVVKALDPAPVVEPAPTARLRPVALLPMRLLGAADPAMVAYRDALDQLIAEWAGVTETQRAEIADQVTAAVDRGDVTALAGIAVTTAGGTAVLTAAMVAMFASIAALTVADAAAQGVADMVAAVPVESALAAVAGVVTSLMASGLADAAGREALRLATPDTTGADVAEAVDQHLAELSDAYLTERLGGGLWRAAAAGWSETVSQYTERTGVQPTYYADEKLDTNTCDACRKVDGQILETWQDVVAAGYAGNGGYRDCKGRERCRGRVKTVWGTP